MFQDFFVFNLLQKKRKMLIIDVFEGFWAVYEYLLKGASLSIGPFC